MWYRLILLLLVLSLKAFSVPFPADVWKEATLYRDEWGVPHVYAETPYALGFVFGYAQAEDHLEHMLLAYRMANGRLAVVIGEGGADSDAFSLKMGHAQLAEAAFPYLDDVTQAICEGFAAGINAWIIDNQSSIPDWVDGVQPQDILAFWHAFLMSMAPFDLPDVYRRPAAMTSSNAWATRREQSSDNATLLVMNPHQYHEGFFQWYEAHLVLGFMNVYGTTLRGLPVIVQGYNENLGWALTPNFADFADIFHEEYASPQRSPKDPRFNTAETFDQQTILLQYMAHSVPYYVRTESGLETRYVPAYIGARGPMFEHPLLGLYSWQIGGYNDFGGLRQLLEMAFAPNLQVFLNALAMHQLPCFHIIYADREDNIFYLYNTKAGMRMVELNVSEDTQNNEQKLRWDQPVSYTYAHMAWSAIIPPENLPAILNPSTGFLQACGSPPWTASGNTGLEPSLWPQWLVADRDTYRAKRVRHLLSLGKRTFYDHQSMLFDNVTPAAFDRVSALFKTVELRQDLVNEMHPDFHEGLAILHKWNFVAEINSPGMTMFHLWWHYCLQRAATSFKSEPEFFMAIEQGMPEAQAILLHALEDASRALKNEYGSLEKQWGEVHRIRVGSREAAFPGSLSGESIFTASDTDFNQGKWWTTYGYGFAMVVKFGTVIEAVSLLPFGVSKKQGSRHFDDQFDLLISRRFKQVCFYRDDVLRHVEFGMGKTVTLMPPGVTGAITMHGPKILVARVTSTVQSPHLIPRDMVPFSLYVAPQRKPSGVPTNVEATFLIPSELCDDNVFSQIRVHRYETGVGWQVVEEQYQDPSTRAIFVKDDSLAEWYVALGPASAADSSLVATSPPDTADTSAGYGLDALLNEHKATPVISGRGKLFRLERHDVSTDSFQNSENQESSQASLGKKFRIEREEESASGDTPSQSSLSLENIPGFHFGPAKRQTKDEEKQEQATVEENSVSNGQEQPKTLPMKSQKQDEVTEKELSSPFVEGEGLQETQSTPPDSIKQSGNGSNSSVNQINESVESNKKRPPLPDIIPHDPNYVFGPDSSTSTQREEKTEGRKKFLIERMR